MRRFERRLPGRSFSLLWFSNHPGAFEVRSLTRWLHVSLWIHKPWFEPYPPGDPLHGLIPKAELPFVYVSGWRRKPGWRWLAQHPSVRVGWFRVRLGMGFRIPAPAARRIANCGGRAVLDYRAWVRTGLADSRIAWPW